MWSGRKAGLANANPGIGAREIPADHLEKPA